MSTTNEPMAEFDEITKQHQTKPATVGFVAKLCKAIVTVTSEFGRQMLGRMDTLDARVALLETKAQKTVGDVRWCGVYAPGTYRAGELVTRNGLWLCIAPSTTAAPGSDFGSWKLIVHRKMVPADDGR